MKPGMAHAGDPLQMLTAALNAPTNSKEQADLLASLRESLEVHPGPIPVLCNSLIKTVSNADDSLLRRWVLDLLHFAICRSSLNIETRTQCASLVLFLCLFKSTESLLDSGHTITRGPCRTTE